MKMKLLLILTFVLGITPASAVEPHQLSQDDSCEIKNRFGHYNLKKPTVKLEPGGKVTLTCNLIFYDKKGKEWIAENGLKSDGASIPRVFWTLVGGPLEGDYRMAALVHDSYCVKRSEPWKQVHKMFYQAMLAAGVEERKAKVMYAAVRYFGPRWDRNRNSTPPPVKSEASAKIVKQWIETSNPSVEKIDNLTLISQITK